MAVNIVWFKRDLRLEDHAPLELQGRVIFESQVAFKPDNIDRH